MAPPGDIYRFAVIADAHFHDTASDFGFAGLGGARPPLVIRPLGDVARSPRVYNEAGQALAHALDLIAADGIRDVILLGDYSDDGQRETLRRLEGLLGRYRQAHGLRFFAVPGNHDIFGENGRHRRKRYLMDSGERMLVASDPAFEADVAPHRIVSPAMYCGGYPGNLPADCGFLGEGAPLHWETPFGTDPDPAARLYPLEGSGGRLMMEASYLVEPVPGVWFLMLDANVFAPDPEGDDGLRDSTSAGWTALLTMKPFLLGWIADVARRAREGGKRLIAFSHYPVLETIDGTLGDELAMIGRHGFQKRMPSGAVAAALIDAGIGIHFSGHVHVNDTARATGEAGASLVNIAVPSLVTYPAAVRIVTLGAGSLDLDLLPLDTMPLDPALMDAYRRERERTGVSTGTMLAARTYGPFLDAHLAHVTGRRFVKREWPAAWHGLLREGSLAELAQAAGIAVEAVPPGLPALEFLIDWYRLRAGSGIALETLDPDRASLYRHMAGLAPASGEGALLAGLFRSMGRHLDGLPSVRFGIDLATGRLQPR